MVPSPVTQVYARLSYAKGLEVEDGFRIQLSVANGIEASAVCTTTNFIPLPKFHLESPSGSASVDDWEMNGKVVRRTESVEADAAPIVAGQGMTKTMAPRTIDYRKFRVEQDAVEVLPLPRVATDVTDFYLNALAAMEGRETQVVTTASVLRCMRVLEAARRSHETGQSIALESPDTQIGLAR